MLALQKCAYTRLGRSSRVIEMNGRLRSYSSDSDCANGHQPSSEKRLTICVVGSGGVGKSSLTVRYLQGHFPEVSCCAVVLLQLICDPKGLINRGVLIPIDIVFNTSYCLLSSSMGQRI